MLDFVHNNTSHPADNRIIIYGVTKVGQVHILKLQLDRMSPCSEGLPEE